MIIIAWLHAVICNFSGEENSVESDLGSDDELPESLLPDDSDNSRQPESQYHIDVWFGGFKSCIHE